MKALASVVVGVLRPPDGWEQLDAFRGRGDNDVIDGQAIERFLLEQCKFEYITHSVRSSSLSASSRASSIALASDAARTAADELSKTAGTRAATIGEHDEFVRVFKKHHNTLVQCRFVSFRFVLVGRCENPFFD